MVGNAYFRGLLKHMSDLESTKIKNAAAESQFRELEARVAELEEQERNWQEERKILLRRIGDNDDTKQ
jgi:FtsZ-binding cell division protein ZapB